MTWADILGGFVTEKKIEMQVHTLPKQSKVLLVALLNPLNGDVSDSHLNAGVIMTTTVNISKCFLIYANLGVLNFL